MFSIDNNNIMGVGHAAVGSTSARRPSYRNGVASDDQRTYGLLLDLDAGSLHVFHLGRYTGCSVVAGVSGPLCWAADVCCTASRHNPGSPPDHHRSGVTIQAKPVPEEWR